MKVISTKQSYLHYFLEFSRYPSLMRGAFVLAIFYVPFDKIRTAFTRSMSLEEEQLRIDYVKWFRKRTMEIPLLQLIITLHCYQDDIRLPEYYVMSLEINGEVHYELDSRDGYTKETLLAFMEDFTAAKNACALKRNVAAERKGIC
ncbi:MAG: hypothetical protein JO154_10880 [Chitinophaga sp.]|uniref:hypothetical protein n=1 Tax=Chitinophaga sp. TaxID=1869181 RepID=UPI0025C560EA|nr:hypothetical protein [Chitinophaga sp.]MBV8253101.1 hypothetical protein [Chitinophaga sp.]